VAAICTGNGYAIEYPDWIHLLPNDVAGPEFFGPMKGGRFGQSLPTSILAVTRRPFDLA
jgi:hypothetical protein